MADENALEYMRNQDEEEIMNLILIFSYSIVRWS